MTALEEVRWSTCCRAPRARLRYVALADRTLSDYRGTGGPSLSLTRVSLFFGEKPVEVFQKQGLLIDGGIFSWMPQKGH